MNATPAPALNMTPEYRNELKNLRILARSLRHEADKIEREARKDIKRRIREAEAANAGLEKRIAAVDRRRQVLTGRLAK